jgi:hypothetical protein
MVLFLGLACIFGGFITVLPLFMEKNPALKRFNEKITPYKIIIGIAILILGVVKFLVPYHPAGRSIIPVFGDLIPSVLAILAGIFISLEFFESLQGVRGKFLERLKTMLQKYQYPIGFAAMFFGILHWIIFRVIFF